jgi:hypothetical protein
MSDLCGACKKPLEEDVHTLRCLIRAHEYILTLEMRVERFEREVKRHV